MKLPYYDAAIIGAGMSGLSAANCLKDAGAHVLVLEAAPKAGGRIDGNLGAVWCHGGDDDPLLPLLQSFGLDYSLDPVTNLTSYFQGQAHGPELRANMMHDLERGLQQVLTADPDGDTTIDESITDPQNRAAADYFRRVWWTALNKNDLSLRDILSDTFGPGGIVLKDGLGALVDCMVALLLPDTIRYNTPVTAITVDGENYIVHTADGQQIGARAVFYSGSVGAIQGGATYMDQVLSPDMRRLMSPDNIVMGNMCKVIFTMPPGFVSRLPEFENRHIDLIDHGLFVHTGIGGKPYITFFFGGEDADRAERMGVDALKYEIISALNKEGILKPYIPILQGHTPDITLWRQNELVRGAYSYVRKNGIRSDKALQNGKFFVIGEAFSPHPCHVSGAHLSGKMAAQQAIPLLGLKPPVRRNPLWGFKPPESHA